MFGSHLGPTARSTLLAVLVAASAAGPSGRAQTAGVPAPPATGMTIALPGATTLRDLPSPLAVEVAVLVPGTEVQILEWHAGWVRLGAAAASGWAPASVLGTEEPVAAEPAAAPPAGAPPSVPERPDRPLLDVRSEVAAALAAAADALGTDGRGGRLGPFSLLTDVADPDLLDYLGRVSDQVPGVFSQRYGLPVAGAADAGGRPGEGPGVHPDLGTVVLFAREGEYRTFTRALADLAGQDPGHGDLARFAGQAAPEVATLSVQGSGPTDVAHTLIHEATHLLIGRTLGRRVPVWLDEGMAGDLELARVDRRRQLVPGPLRARPGGPGRRPRLEGPLGALADLLGDARRGRLEGAEELFALERRDFYRSPRRRELYAVTALWIRFLLEGEDGELAPGFRAWLAAAAADPAVLAGGRDGAGSLPDRLGRTPAELDRGFRIWLHDLARRLRVGV